MNTTYLRNHDLLGVYHPTSIPYSSNYTSTPFTCNTKNCLIWIILLSLSPFLIFCCLVCGSRNK